MSFNMFLWLREGVRQSILLGVSDAIDTLGTPDDGEQMRPELAAMLRQDAPQARVAKSGGSAQRKRLGRSLKDLDAAPEA